MPQDIGSLIFLAFGSSMTLLVGIFAFLARSVRDDFKEMSKNIHGLAVNLASLTTRLESLDTRLEKLERLKED